MPSNEEYIHNEYNIMITFRHPAIIPDTITKKLGIIPTVKQVAGDNIVTPKGKKLTGIYQTNLWRYSRSVDKKRSIENEILQFLENLKSNEDFVKSVLDTGGSVSIYFQFSGAVNVGGKIGRSVLLEMGRLGIDLEVEVFP